MSARNTLHHDYPYYFTIPDEWYNIVRIMDGITELVGECEMWEWRGNHRQTLDTTDAQWTYVRLMHDKNHKRLIHA